MDWFVLGMMQEALKETQKEEKGREWLPTLFSQSPQGSMSPKKPRATGDWWSIYTATERIVEAFSELLATWLNAG